MAESRPVWWSRALRWSGSVVVWCFVFLVVLWCALALYFSTLPGFLRPWAAWAFVGAAAAVLVFLKPRRRAWGVFLALVAAVLVYWVFIPPSNDRLWRKDVSVLPWTETDGTRVTVHNIRNSVYRTATDFDLHHYDKTFDVNQLRSMDFYMCFWAPMPFCHTMMSFGFENGDTLCVSIETRPEEHETYSALASCFKQYELIYVAGDERDLVRLRSNVRDEIIYLYHINTTPEAMCRVFLRYCKRMNELKAHPEWYYILTRNCTTDIPRRNGENRWMLPESWKVILNGFVDQYLYRERSLDQSMPLEELRRVGHINARAQNADKDPAFSRLIRVGIPELQPAVASSRQRSEQ